MRRLVSFGASVRRRGEYDAPAAAAAATAAAARPASHGGGHMRRRLRAPSAPEALARPAGARCTHGGASSQTPQVGTLRLGLQRRSHSTGTDGQGGFARQKPKRSKRSMLKAEIAHALEKEVDSLQTRLRIEGAKFDQWRRRNVALLLTAGGVAGGMTLAILATVYVRSHPQIIDYSIAWLAKVEFDATSSYDVRKRTYMALPEPQISVSSLEAQILASLTDGAGEKDEDESGSKLALAWASMTSKAFAAVDGSSLLATKAAMRKELVEEIRGRDAATAAAAGTADAAAAAAIARKLAELRDLLPLSLERNIYVTEELSKYMDDHAADGRCAYPCCMSAASCCRVCCTLL